MKKEPKTIVDHIGRIISYNENGNPISCRDPENGLEEKWEYDKNGNEIYHKFKDGAESWKEYDKNGNMIHYTLSTGFEEWREYDEMNREIHYKNSNGYEYWKEYGEDNMIYYTNSEGLDYCYDKKQRRREER